MQDKTIDEKFEIASEYIKTSSNQLTNSDKLLLYGLSQQAIHGDCNKPMPLESNLVGNLKWNAWNEFKGISKKNAKSEYLTAVTFLCKLPNSFFESNSTVTSYSNLTTNHKLEDSLIISNTSNKYIFKKIERVLLLWLVLILFSSIGFITSILNKNALILLGFISFCYIGFLITLLGVHRKYGLIPVLWPSLQQILLEKSLIDFLLEGNFLKSINNIIIEIKPIFYCKTQTDRIAVLENMSNKTRRLMSTRGIINLMHPWIKKFILSNSQLNQLEIRLKNENLAYNPPINLGMKGNRHGNPTQPNLNKQRKLGSDLLKKHILDIITNNFLDQFNIRKSLTSFSALLILFILQCHYFPFKKKTCILFFRRIFFYSTSFAAFFHGIIILLYNLSKRYKKIRKLQDGI